MVYRTGHKRRRGPSAYDRIQDAKIRKLEVIEEQKSHDKVIAIARTDVQLTWSAFTILNDMTQGDTNLTRDGDSCSMQSLFLRLTITPTFLSEEIGGVALRIVIIRKKVSSGAFPTAAIAFSVDNINGLIRRDQNISGEDIRGNLQFLYDKTFNINVNSQERQIKMYFNLKGMEATYASSGTSPHRNGLYIAICKTGSVADWNLEGNSRVMFKG